MSLPVCVCCGVCVLVVVRPCVNNKMLQVTADRHRERERKKEERGRETERSRERGNTVAYIPLVHGLICRVMWRTANGYHFPVLLELVRVCRCQCNVPRACRC